MGLKEDMWMKSIEETDLWPGFLCQAGCQRIFLKTKNQVA